MRTIIYAVKVIGALALCVPALAMATESVPDNASSRKDSAATQTATEPLKTVAITPDTPVSVNSATTPVAITAMGPALSADQLDGYRGGADTVLNDMTLSGTVANNSTVNVASGNNILTGAAFSNTSGFATAIQNSGSNVLIQNATIVNVQFQ